jgi:hypothetical protein
MWRCLYCTAHVKDEVASCPTCHRERPPSAVPADGPEQTSHLEPQWLPPELTNKEVTDEDPFAKH